jgi:hypothetical protein
MPWSNTRPKASSTARGYDYQHRKLRALRLPYAYGTPCVRCGESMLPGQALEFDHNDARTGYLGFSHADCNRKAGAQKGRRLQIVKPRRKVVDRW